MRYGKLVPTATERNIMAPRITQLEWTERAIKVLQNRAQDAGLLGTDERLVYRPPNRQEGTDARIEVFDSNGKAPDQHAFWLPMILPKDTNRTVERLADQQARILYALDLKNRFVRAVDRP